MSALTPLLGKVNGGVTTVANQQVSANEWNLHVQCTIDLLAAQSNIVVKNQTTGLIGTRNGINVAFNVGEEYRPGTLKVFLQGNVFSEGIGISETDPANGDFEFVGAGNIPLTSDDIHVLYGKPM